MYHAFLYIPSPNDIFDVPIIYTFLASLESQKVYVAHKTCVTHTHAFLYIASSNGIFDVPTISASTFPKGARGAQTRLVSETNRKNTYALTSYSFSVGRDFAAMVGMLLGPCFRRTSVTA